MERPETLFAGKIIDRSNFVNGPQVDCRVYKKRDAEEYFNFLEKRIDILKDRLKAAQCH